MKYICLGYMEEKVWTEMTPERRETFLDECSAFSEALREDGLLLGGEALQSIRTAATIRLSGREVSVTDGPYAETKEHLGGILIIRARDLNHAILLMSAHPALKLGGCFEVRPAEGPVCCARFVGEAPLALENTAP